MLYTSELALSLLGGGNLKSHLTRDLFQLLLFYEVTHFSRYMERFALFPSYLLTYRKYLSTTDALVIISRMLHWVKDLKPG